MFPEKCSSGCRMRFGNAWSSGRTGSRRKGRR
uniref:Uncharacterized protein n=1 Tax=Anguilla anguilla TaxID=7936 RepID=A0A0E9US76_ANGAN